MSEYTQKDIQGKSVGIVEKKALTIAEPPGELALECGRKLGPITLAYETYGTLNANKDNAVLVLHALSGDAHVAGVHSPEDEKPGWWDSMVGPEKGIDTDKYFVICSNIIGSCMGSTGPCSIDPRTVMPYGLEFPVVTIGDMVRAQKTLIEALGITRLLAVVGGSVGGMQVLEWCVRLSGHGGGRHSAGHHDPALGPGHRLQRSRPPGHHGRPQLEQRRLLFP